MLKSLLISLYLIAHPVHVSILSIDYLPEEVSFSVFFRVFYDDFLLDGGKSIHTGNEKGLSGNDSLSDSLILKYVNEKIDICVNDKRLTGELGNVTLADNELSVNLKYGSDGKIDRLTIRNRVMTDLYEDQANMIIVRVKDFEEGIKLTSDSSEQTFNIKQ